MKKLSTLIGLLESGLRGSKCICWTAFVPVKEALDTMAWFIGNGFSIGVETTADSSASLVGFTGVYLTTEVFIIISTARVNSLQRRAIHSRKPHEILVQGETVRIQSYSRESFYSRRD